MTELNIKIPDVVLYAVAGGWLVYAISSGVHSYYRARFLSLKIKLTNSQKAAYDKVMSSGEE